MIRAVFQIFIVVAIASCGGNKSEIKKESDVPKFSLDNDLMLLHYDCKTDVDDLHTVAAMASLIRIPKFSKLNYHAVAGAYGIQEGEYVPGNSLFNLAFSNRWSDAHLDHDKALDEVFINAKGVLDSGGNIWIAEAGQSDFSSKLVKKVQESMKQIDTKQRINIVQHSNWNEEVTSQDLLAFAKENTNYHKIPDGNALDNGTPGFNSSTRIEFKEILSNEKIMANWDLAISLADTYNGKEGRYLNKSINAGGLDFSDFSEVHYILELEGIENGKDYFEFIASQN